MQLSGAPVEAPDIRAGAALVLAGLAAAGETEIIGLEYIDRGYERSKRCSRPSAAKCSAAAASRRWSNRAGMFETREYPRVSSATG